MAQAASNAHRAELQKAAPAATAEASKLLTAGKLEEAESAIAPYSTLSDPSVRDLSAAIQEQILRRNLAKTAVTDHQTRLNLLELIADIKPDDALITQQRAHERDALKHAADLQDAADERIANVPDGAFCARFRQHKNDPALHASYLRRGGTEARMDTVLQKEVSIGMSEFEVHCAWGPPAHTNRTLIGNSIEDKQLVYGDIPASYIYLRNGVVTSLQDSR